MGHIFYDIIHTTEGDKTTVDRVYSRRAAMTFGKGKNVTWERGVELYPADYKAVGQPVPENGGMSHLFFQEDFQQDIFVENEQLTMRTQCPLGGSWVTVAQDEKYDIKLHEDGKRLFLVDQNPRLRK